MNYTSFFVEIKKMLTNTSKTLVKETNIVKMF